MRSFAAGDPVRGLAVVGITVFHTSYFALVANDALPRGEEWPQAYGAAAPLLDGAELSLSLFFVLSGYLLWLPFARWLVAGARRPALGRYLRNRLLRIVPVFYVVLAVLAVRHGIDGDAGWALVSVPLFAQSYFPSIEQATFPVAQAWTLDVELAFYLFLPVLAVVGLRGRARPAPLLALLVALFAGSIALRAAGPPTAQWLHAFPMVLHALVPGMVLATLEAAWGDRAPRAPGWLAPALFAGGLLAFAAATTIERAAASSHAVLASLGAGLFLAGPLLHQLRTGGSWPVLDNRVLRWVGERSYPMYAVHFAVGLELFRLAGRTGGVWPTLGVWLPAALAVSVALAAALHRTVELPAMRLRTAWRG